LPLDARFRGHDAVGGLMPHVVMTGIAARRFTGGLTEFDVEANTVRRMITELDRRFPGLGHQIDEGRLSRSTARSSRTPTRPSSTPTAKSC
jgi:hypothetical protein